MVQQILGLGQRLWADTRLRYLAVGGVNTVFGYGVSLVLYYGLHHWLHLIAISIIINIICITFSFLTYKVFVFQTKGQWIREYLRCYVVYGAGIVIGTLLLWVLVDFFDVPFWIAQLIILCIGIAISYLGHKNHTFKRRAQ